jgi:hypothetical protein
MGDEVKKTAPLKEFVERASVSFVHFLRGRRAKVPWQRLVDFSPLMTVL